MNKVNAIIKTLFTPIIIITLLLTIFYHRVLKERAIGPLDTQTNIVKIGIYVIFIGFYLYLIFRQFYPPEKETIVLKGIKKINDWYIRAIQDTYNLFIDIITPQYIKKTDIFVIYWVNIPTTVHKLLIYMIKIGIPLIIGLFFLYEILVKKGIYYFPKILWLLLLYFFLDFIWNIVIIHTQSYIEACETGLLKVRLDENNQVISIDLPDKDSFDEQTYAGIQEHYFHLVREYVVAKDETLPFLLQYKTLFNLKGKTHLQTLRLTIWLASWTTLLLYMFL